MEQRRPRTRSHAHALPARQKRLRILDKEEVATLYGRPRFTFEERAHYFSLSPAEYDQLQEFRSVKSQVSFVLHLGYFKARHMCFSFGLSEVSEDLQYVLVRHCHNRPLPDQHPVDTQTRGKQQRAVLTLCGYRPCDRETREQLAAKARHAARVSSKPVYILRALLQYLTDQQRVTPGYSFLQDTVGKALTTEQNRLRLVLRQQLKPTEQGALRQLLEDAPGLYALTQLKREPRDFSAQESKREIQRRDQLRPLYHCAQALLPACAISNESIHYYASLVTFYSVARLKRFDSWIVHLYLLCFVSQRYQCLHDNLLNSLRHPVRHYTDEAKEAAKERVYAYQMEGNQHLQKAGQVLKLFTDDRIEATTPFQKVQTLAFAILPRSQLDCVATQIATTPHFDETAFQWEHLDTLAPQFKLQVRPIVGAVEFAASSDHSALLEAVQFLQTAVRTGRSLSLVPSARFPVRFVPDASRRYLYGQDPQGRRQLLPNRYEFLVYRLLRNGLEAGDIFCRESLGFLMSGHI
jgi:hypothetical protein